MQYESSVLLRFEIQFMEQESNSFTIQLSLFNMHSHNAAESVLY
jgi:hypothetical protein